MKERRFKDHKQIIYLPIYFLILVLSLLITENLKAGLKILEYNLSFLALPIIFLQFGRVNEKQKTTLYSFFSYGVTIITFFLLVNAVLRYVEVGNSEEFFYHAFTSPIDFHPVYLSIYVYFAILISIHFMARNGRVDLLNVIKLLFYALALFLLSSKSVLLYTCFTGILFILYTILKTINKIKLFSFLLILITVLTLALQSDFIKNRFKEVLHIDSLSELKHERMTDFEKVNGLTLRLMFVKFSIQDFLQDPMNIPFGLGLGDRKEFLNSVYENHNMARTIKEQKLGYYDYNTHNQYVEIFLGLGIIGLIYFFWMFFYYIWSTKEKFISKSTYGLFIWGFLFEAILNRNKGIVFFVFWTIVFVYNESREYKKEKTYIGKRNQKKLSF
ncbi:O-antigen ligase family protein [Ascidiimonas aurantiaca]|uniref:O-antigen ligase family protein n=1 Tax=Ascidiimonas aurantiaca TaxID=1685432 RepID=UPI0030EBD434